MSEWRHSQRRNQWELGYWDEPRQEFVVRSWVTDEFIARTDHRMAAASLHARLGTVPPPLAGHLPEPPPLRMSTGPAGTWEASEHG